MPKQRPTKRAADGGYAPRFLSFIVALSVSRFDGDSRPSHLPLTRAVGTLTAKESENLVVAWESCYDVNMIQSFKDAGTQDIFNGENTKAARKICPSSLWKIAARKLDQVDSVTRLSELRIPPNNKLEALSGDRKGQHSIRVNDQYRICFVWTESGPDQVEIVDYH